MIRLSKRFNVVDHPNDRKIHKTVTPLLGGLAIYFGFCLTIISHLPFDNTLIAILTGATFITIFGLLDDIFGSRAIIKLLGQVMAASITYYMGISISFISNPFGDGVIYLGWLAAPITIIWIVGIINTINLIDGVDGLASGIAAISAFFLTIVAIQGGAQLPIVITVALLGSCLGFLRYNFPPAKIFLGDSGAMLIGYLLAVVSIMGVLKSTIAVTLAIPILVLGLPITDTAFAIFRRIKEKRKIFHPDTDHIHHKLIKRGLSHKKTAIFLYGVSLGLGSVGLLFSLLSGLKLAVVILTMSGCTAAIWIIYKRKQSLKRQTPS